MNKNVRLVFSIFWTLIGVALMALCFTGIIDKNNYLGFGAGLTAVGIVQLIRNIRYRANPEYREKVDIANGDERNRYIAARAWGVAGYAMLFLEAIGVIVCFILGKEEIGQLLCFMIALEALIYVIAWRVISRKS